MNSNPITGAPYRADHVGSLLRPAAVHDARQRYSAGDVGPDGFTTNSALKAVEDAAIADAVALQERVGLKAVTDGEYRRSFWHLDFLGALVGLELVERDQGVQFQGQRLRPIHPTITGPLDFPDDHPMLEHFGYLASVTRVQPKMSIPGPSACHFRTAQEDIHPAEYADLEVLFADIAKTYARARIDWWGLLWLTDHRDTRTAGIVLLLMMVGSLTGGVIWWVRRARGTRG